MTRPAINVNRWFNKTVTRVGTRGTNSETDACLCKHLLDVKPECKMSPTFASSTGWGKEKWIQKGDIRHVPVEDIVRYSHE